MAKKKETVLVLSAHTDDFVVGAGGTIAKYSRDGKKVLAIVFSCGEKSHPWLKESFVKKFREEEAREASRLLGCRIKLFDLGDQNVYEDYKKQKLESELLRIIRREKPTKIFTHSSEDSHLSLGLLSGRDDHKAVHKITLELLEKIRPVPEVYVYSIWTPVSFKTNFPALYVNVSSTFAKKLKAMNKFRSQRWNAIYPLMLLVFHRAFTHGFKIRKWFAESFYRLK